MLSGDSKRSIRNLVEVCELNLFHYFKIFNKLLKIAVMIYATFSQHYPLAPTLIFSQNK